MNSQQHLSFQEQNSLSLLQKRLLYSMPVPRRRLRSYVVGDEAIIVLIKLVWARVPQLLRRQLIQMWGW